MKSNANLKRACLATALLASLTLGACALVPAGESNSMSFFVTSKNPGKGGDLGGRDQNLFFLLQGLRQGCDAGRVRVGETGGGGLHINSRRRCLKLRRPSEEGRRAEPQGKDVAERAKVE